MKLLSLLFFLLAVPVVTAAPKLETLFPSGGQRGTSVDVVAGGTFNIWPVRVWTSHPGIIATPDKKVGQLAIQFASDVPCGVHWLRAFDKTGASGLRPFLVNQLSEVNEKEPNDDFKKSQEISSSSVIINGRLEKNDDVDHFAVHLKKGQTLVAAVEAYRTLRSPMDAVLQIVSPDGFVLAQNDDYADIDPLLAFESPKEGVYLVRLFCFPSKADSRVGFFGKDTCIYRLTLTTGPMIDRTWPLAVERDGPAEVELHGWNIPADRVRWPVPKSLGDDRSFLHPLGFVNGVWVRTEPYRTLMNMGNLGSPPVSVSGRLSAPGERANFRFDGVKGKTLSISVEAREQGLPLDAVLTVRDASGKVLKTMKSAKLNLDPTLEFTPPADGLYSLEVRDLHDDGGPRHLFLVRIRPAEPDFLATLAADHFDGKAGTPLELPLAVEYRFGMKGPLDVRVEGLPDSVRVEFVPGKDLKKSFVRILGLDAGFNGPIQIFAKAPGQSERVIHAVTEWSVPHVWLAIAGK